MKLFVSYRSTDSDRVDRIVKHLRSLKDESDGDRYIVWQDKDSIPAGKDWWEAIVDAITDCEVFLFMVSSESVQSINCLAELSYARKRNRPIIPIVLENEYTFNPKSGKNDVSYWSIIPSELTDSRPQFLFDEGASFVGRLEQAFEQIQREPQRYRDIPTPKPPDPRPAVESNSDTSSLYDFAVDAAHRLEFDTAEKYFQRLINSNDVDFNNDAFEWIMIIRDYKKIINYNEKRTTRHRVPELWVVYIEKFPKPFVDFFDPKGIKEQLNSNNRGNLEETKRQAALIAEQQAKDLSEREEAESQARLLAEQQAKEKAAKEEADRQAQILADRLAKEKDEKEEAARQAQLLADRQAKEKAAQEEANRQAILLAERQAKEKAAKEEAARQAQLLADRQAKEKAARQEAERQAQILADRQAKEKIERDEIERRRIAVEQKAVADQALQNAVAQKKAEKLVAPRSVAIDASQNSNAKSADNLVGQEVGRYRFAELIRDNGLLKTYIGIQFLDGKNSRQVSITVFPHNSVREKMRFERESQVVASLNHPHIATVFDYGEKTGEYFYQVGQLITKSLDEITEISRQTKIQFPLVLKILEQIASALDYAHKRGVVHRDLNPNDILLDSEENAYVANFGISKTLELDTLGGNLVGTPAYLSPEQWQGMAVDSRTDIYALGVVIFQILSGQLPFQSDTPFKVMYGHINETPPSVHSLRSEIPIAVDNVLYRALAKNPNDRFQTASEFYEALKLMIRTKSK